ncbi:MAG: DUF5060 domain-containing protein [bacterium]
MRKKITGVIFLSIALLCVFGAELRAAPSINSVAENSDPVGAYEKLELTVGLSASYSNAYNPDEVSLSAVFTSPTSVVWNVNGFYDGSSWLIRFAANETGSWSYIISLTDSTGTATSSTYTFTCSSSSHHGWLEVSPTNSRYLIHDDGTSFYGIGHCRAWNPETTPLSTLAAYGGNFLVYWNGPPWERMIESKTQGIGQYDQDECDYIDSLVGTAETNDVYLALVIWPHNALRDETPWSDGKWTSNNPYSTITSAVEFYTDASSWSYQQKLYRYIIARWGYSRAIGVWDIVCEIDGTAGYVSDRTAAETWCSNVQSYFDSNDPFAHLTAGSKSGDVYWAAGYNIFDLPEMHTYNDKRDEDEIATTIATNTRRMWNNFTKPNFHGEFGTDMTSSLQPEHFHNAIWAGLASGAAITPLDWNDGGDWGDLTAGMLNHMSYFADFIDGVDFGNISLTPATVSAGSYEVWGMRTNDYAIAWVQSTSGNVDSETFTISNLNDRNYQLQWYNTWTGEITAINNDVASSGNSLSDTIPAVGRSDIACKIIGSSPPSAPAAPSGDTSGTYGTSYTYSVSTTDSDGDQLKYTIDWGDGNTTTSSLVASGTTFEASHAWSYGGTYDVKVRAQDSNGTISEWSSETEMIITGPAQAGSTDNLILRQNYPNPFYISVDSVTSMRYTLTRRAKVTIKIYDLSMRLVKSLVSDEWKDPGTHEDSRWSGDNDNGNGVGSGLYFYHIEAEFESGSTKSSIGKMMMVK